MHYQLDQEGPPREVTACWCNSMEFFNNNPDALLKWTYVDWRVLLELWESHLHIFHVNWHSPAQPGSQTHQ